VPETEEGRGGVIPTRYDLVEMKSASYLARTEANVIDSHCTLVFTFGPLSGGSKKTVEFAKPHERPCLCLDLAAMAVDEAAKAVLAWLSVGGLIAPGVPAPPPFPVLNVAGSRESKATGIQERVRRVMAMVFNPPFYSSGAE